MRALRVALLISLLVSCQPTEHAGEDPGISTGSRLSSLTQGEQLVLSGTSGILQYTRVWLIGNQNNIKRIYFVIHGDTATDYSDQTSADRTAMTGLLPVGEGAIVAYPVSVSQSWSQFQDGANGLLLLSMFHELEAMTSNADVRFEQFSLGGGGRVNYALLKLITEQYNTSPEVKEFVHNHLRGIHDGDAIVYNTTEMKQSYKTALQNFHWLRASFTHSTSRSTTSVYPHHNEIAMHFNNGQGFPAGGTLTLQSGRLRFWSAADALGTWAGQFSQVFLGTDWAPVPSPSKSWIGKSCVGSDTCVSTLCFYAIPSLLFYGGMCSQTCDQYCPDVPFEPETFCISFNPQTGQFEGDQGHCFPQCDTTYYPGTGCRTGYACMSRPRHGDPQTQKNVCIPDPNAAPTPDASINPPPPDMGGYTPPLDGGPQHYLDFLTTSGQDGGGGEVFTHDSNNGGCSLTKTTGSSTRTGWLPLTLLALVLCLRRRRVRR